MTEHVCEWGGLFDNGFAGCIHCNEAMTQDEVARRINATFRLSVEDARLVAKELMLEYCNPGWNNPRMKKIHNDLLAYANILEDKDA